MTYAGFAASMVAFLLNSVTLDEADRQFSLTPSDTQALVSYHQHLATPDISQDDRRDALRRLIFALLARDLSGDRESLGHPFITFVIAHSIGLNLVFAAPKHITPFLAGLQYVFRGVAFLQVLELHQLNTDVPVLDILRDNMRWLQTTHHTFFSWLRRMISFASTYAINSQQAPRFLYGPPGTTSFNFDGVDLTYNDWRNLLRNIITDTHKSFADLVEEWGIPLPSMSIDQPVIDHVSQTAPGFSYINHGPNVWLVQRASRIRAHVLDSNKFTTFIDGTLVPKPSKIKRLMDVSLIFLINLMVCFLTSGGQPPRGTEVSAMLRDNIEHRVRNAYIINEALVILGMLNKTTFTAKVDKYIPRAYPILVTHMFIAYDTFLRPLESILANLLDPQRPQTLTNNTLDHVFFFNGKQLDTDHLTARLQQFTKQHLPLPVGHTGFGTAALRQLAIYVGRKWVHPEEFVPENSAIMDLQGGHSTVIADKWYGVEGNTLASSLTTYATQAFVGVSVEHHVQFQLENLGEVGQPVRSPLPHSSSSTLTRIILASGSPSTPQRVPPSNPPRPIPPPTLRCMCLVFSLWAYPNPLRCRTRASRLSPRPGP